jgi:uncharacterized protein (TIRG00374 family)
MADFKNPWIKRAGILVAIIPFIWIYRRLDFHTMLSILPKVAWWTIPLLFAGTLTSMTLQGTRWWLLLRAFTDEIPYLRALSYHFTSIYYSTILPTSAGQEVLRTLFVLKKAGAAVGWGAAWICKITALMLSLIFSVYGLASLSRTTLPRGLMIGIAAFCILICLIGFISFSKSFTAPMRRMASRIIPAKFLATVENIREGVYQYRHKKKAMLITLVLTFFIQGILIFNTSIVIMGITGKLYFWECLAFMPIIEIASMSVPITPNGMGIREALTALMFKYIGLSNEQLGIYIIIILSGNLLRLVGAIPVFFDMGKSSKSFPGDAEPKSSTS